jgi:hypothetical protein
MAIAIAITASWAGPLFFVDSDKGHSAYPTVVLYKHVLFVNALGHYC